jgi:hypothetical protein
VGEGVVLRVRNRGQRGGGPVENGHHMAEEAPQQPAGELTRFRSM